MSTPPLTASARTADGYLGSRSAAWLTFTLVFLLMIMDYIDRMIVVSMFPHLKEQFQLSDQQLGTLVSIVSVMAGILTIPIAYLVDRWKRARSIMLMGTLWSIATIACAVAGNHTQLLVARAFVGVGEAGYAPAGSALLTTYFPKRLRGFVVGAFLSAAGLGSLLGVVLGGVIATNWGWKAAFGVVGIPGLVLALMFFFVKDYKTVQISDAKNSKSPSFLQTLGMILKPQTAWLTIVGTALQAGVISSMIAWLPSFFSRTYGMPTAKAGMTAGMVLLAMSVGAVFWGYAIDNLGLRSPRRKLYGMAVLMLATSLVFSMAFGQIPVGPQQIALIIFGGFVMACTIGTSAAIVIDVVNPAARASATGFTALGQNLLGIALGPIVLGYLSDNYGLDRALGLLPLISIIGALFLLKAARSYESDMAAVVNTLDA